MGQGSFLVFFAASACIQPVDWTGRSTYGLIDICRVLITLWFVGGHDY
jgi:hypothetical protein